MEFWSNNDKCYLPYKLFKKPDGVAPEFKWDGFSMAGGAGYECEACGESLMIFEESDKEVLERVNATSK